MCKRNSSFFRKLVLHPASPPVQFCSPETGPFLTARCLHQFLQSQLLLVNSLASRNKTARNDIEREVSSNWGIKEEKKHLKNIFSGYDLLQGGRLLHWQCTEGQIKKSTKKAQRIK